jgi:hypothetical protein
MEKLENYIHSKFNKLVVKYWNNCFYLENRCVIILFVKQMKRW